ncbi:Eukaryotic membrane protein family [Pleurostoma richardsiae]|uniref:Eukaryotic membrane protein family n=1 Tax=Pleurostoma richardsiae TaxID=41990 RepID=A0AA38VSV8_9PEZI|nr:Eukaryotic membrane protein family [Pleurostoma richardsiae]
MAEGEALQQNGHRLVAAAKPAVQAIATFEAPERAASQHKISLNGPSRRDTGTETVASSAGAHLPSPALTPTDPFEPHLSVPDTSAEDELPMPTPNGQSSPSPTPKNGSSHDGHSEARTADTGSKDLAEDAAPAKSRSRSGTKSSTHSEHVRRLSASKIQELTAAPESLPVATLPDHPLSASAAEAPARPSVSGQLESGPPLFLDRSDSFRSNRLPDPSSAGRGGLNLSRPVLSSRTLSTPPTSRRRSSGQQSASQPSAVRRNSLNPAARPAPLNLEGGSNFPLTTTPRATVTPSSRPDPALDTSRPPSPIPPAIPLPPLSVPTVLQLELAAQRPSPLYIHQSYANDIPYESSAVKFERLKNFLVLPFFLEGTLTFGALACLDAFLWTFTILPMRFCVAFGVLFRWWAYVIGKEARWLIGFVWEGLGRMWRRGRQARGRTLSSASCDSSRSTESRSRSRARDVGNGTAGLQLPRTGASVESARRPEPSRAQSNGAATHHPARGHSKSHGSAFRHRRTKSMPSNLNSFHKADLLQGAVIIFSSMALMRLDASRMYHFIRAQSAIKLYVIYNLLEVSDRLFSALGQDIFECLFSSETLSRNSSGRSKIMLPFGMFLLSLVYTVAHSITLFYQVITLNVAVNSYSNALLSLLLSNQFVEIKSSVFKRFEKENTFQLTCADMVERFELWIMLTIIGLRNVVEVGGLSVPGAGSELGDEGGPSALPIHSPSILPFSFTILPSWFWSGEVLSPFLIVIGSEMLVDWIKHAYINKFNNIKPNFYSRILDILAKDYYTNAFVTPALTRRLGLPLLPLSCLFIRATVQVYQMFVVTRVPAPLPPSTQTSLSVESAIPSSPAVVAALDRFDSLIRNALGRAVYGYPYDAAAGSAKRLWLTWTSDDAIAALTMLIVFFIAFLALLVVKLLLGMVLLRFSRDRYAAMKLREHDVAAGRAEREVFDAKGKRIGGHGQVEVGEERRRWIYEDDKEGLRKAVNKERRAEEKAARGEERDLSTVSRYEMIAKRIW